MKLKELQLQRFTSICNSGNVEDILGRVNSFDDFPAVIVFGSSKDVEMRKKWIPNLGQCSTHTQLRLCLLPCTDS
jgi:hypothetical protein